MNVDKNQKDALEENPVISVYGIRIRRSNYKVIQCLCIVVFLILAVLSYVFLREANAWYLRYAWVVFAIGVVAEAIETFIFQKNVVDAGEPGTTQVPKAIPYAKNAGPDDESHDEE